ncbi:unnamed protein product [Soboliphyme baturini]|uniref:BSD domain-containing protein n=1 Tax=Soboliphyme baturini TaxID=241478 RepID=A0A183I9F0_9BILA|nr:unnamed protein product [Soboliphyme baturini]
MYYLRGNVPEHPIINDYDEYPLFLSILRKDPPVAPLQVSLEVNKLSGGKLKHLLAGSPSGEWSQETERILEVDVRRMIDENRAVHPLLTSDAKPKHFWKDFLEKKKKALLEEPKETAVTPVE